MNREEQADRRLAVIEQHLHCCEAEHYGCTQWGISDVRWLLKEVKRRRTTRLGLILSLITNIALLALLIMQAPLAVAQATGRDEVQQCAQEYATIGDELMREYRRHGQTFDCDSLSDAQRAEAGHRAFKYNTTGTFADNCQPGATVKAEFLDISPRLAELNAAIIGVGYSGIGHPASCVWESKIGPDGGPYIRIFAVLTQSDTADVYGVYRYGLARLWQAPAYKHLDGVISEPPVEPKWFTEVERGSGEWHLREDTNALEWGST